jgi:hypothetical protein
MKNSTNQNGRIPPLLALKALRRAAKNAISLARSTGTPAYVMENGRIVDIAKRPVEKTKRRVSKKR